MECPDLTKTDKIEELVDGSFIRYNNVVYCDICMLENLAKSDLHESAVKIKLMQNIIDMCRRFNGEEESDE